MKKNPIRKTVNKSVNDWGEERNWDARMNEKYKMNREINGKCCVMIDCKREF